MKKTFVLNMLLAVLWTLQTAAVLVCRAFWPAGILLPMDIPLLLGISLVALLLEYWIVPDAQRSYLPTVLLAAATLGLLPLCAGIVSAAMAIRLAVIGGIAFAVATVLFDSMHSRLSSGADTKAAPVMAAFGLFLAGQCFTNIFF